jgi:PAS domain S-box-containing protein
MSTSSETSVDSFDYFKALFANSKQNKVLLINTDGTIVKVNEAFTTAFGYSQHEIEGKPLKILFTDEDRQRGLPEREIKNVLSKGQCDDNNYLVNKNNDVTWVSGESILVKGNDGAVCILKVIQDINSQKTFENWLRESNEFNDRILATIDDVVIVVDGDLNLIKSNKAFTDLFDGSESNASPGVYDLLQLFEKHEVAKKIKSTIETGVGFIDKELEIETSTEKRMFDVTCRPIEPVGDANHLLLVLHDRTLEHQFSKQRDDIIGFVAHELRNPLANVVLCNELIDKTLKESNIPVALSFLERSQSNVLRLNKMIAELYDATKAGSGNLQLENSGFNFEEMIHEAIETLKVLHPKYNIIVKGSANLKVHGDRYRIIQVVTNYLSNGIKYSEGHTEVELSLKHDDKSVTVAVKDNGLGIAKDQQPFIFNRFYRADHTKNLEGMGLGLFLCRKIISAHNGSVWVESDLGKGSTFYFSIPL